MFFLKLTTIARRGKLDLERCDATRLQKLKMMRMMTRMLVVVLQIASEVPIAPETFEPHPQQSGGHSHQQQEVE